MMLINVWELLFLVLWSFGCGFILGILRSPEKEPK